MKKEILVISDNFNEYSKYRSILETKYTVSLRSSFDEIKTFLEENNETIGYVIIDVDDSINNGLLEYIDLIVSYNLPYIVVVDSRDFSNNLKVDYDMDDNIISRQSIYQNLVSLIYDDFNNNMEEFYYDE